MILTPNAQRQALIFLLTFGKQTLKSHGCFSSVFPQNQMLGGTKGASSPASSSAEGRALVLLLVPVVGHGTACQGNCGEQEFCPFLNCIFTAPFLCSLSADELEAFRNFLVK